MSQRSMPDQTTAELFLRPLHSLCCLCYLWIVLVLVIVIVIGLVGGNYTGDQYDITRNDMKWNGSTNVQSFNVVCCIIRNGSTNFRFQGRLPLSISWEKWKMWEETECAEQSKGTVIKRLFWTQLITQAEPHVSLSLGNRPTSGWDGMGWNGSRST